MKKYAVIVAGGSGTRLGGNLPKQFQSLNGRPVLWWSMDAFRREDPATEIIVVLNPDFENVWRELYVSLPESDRIRHTICPGGNTRTESVKNGLVRVPDGEDVFVAVHDAARPLVTTDMIARGWEAAGRWGAAVPAIPVTDSLRRLCGSSSEAVDRKDYVVVQTPQVFRADILRDAYMRNPDAVFTDDASAAEAGGHTPAIYDGSPLNMKVTNPGDMEVASIWLHHGETSVIH